MPANDNDMTAPATRRDLHDLRTELRGDMNNLRTELRGDMDNLRTELRTDMANLRTDMADLRTELTDLRTGLRAELQADMQDMLRVLNEENRAWFRAIDDQYKDLPGRVLKLEEALFPAPRSRRRKSG